MLLTAQLLFSLPTMADTVSLWTIFTQTGIRARDRRDFDLAEKMFAEALERAESFGAFDSRLALSLKNLAELYAIRGNLSAAEPLYKRLISIGLKDSRLSIRIVPALRKYAKLLELSKKFDMAISIDVAVAQMLGAMPVPQDQGHPQLGTAQ